MQVGVVAAACPVATVMPMPAPRLTAAAAASRRAFMVTPEAFGLVPLRRPPAPSGYSLVPNSAAQAGKNPQAP